MAGKKGTTRTATIKDMKEVKHEAARLAKEHGWSTSEFLDYCLRMGVNRCLALERQGKGGSPRKASKKTARKPRAAKRAAKPAPAETNGASAIA